MKNDVKQDKFKVRMIGNRWQLQKRKVWDNFEVISTHSTESLAYKALRKAEREEMRNAV